MNPGLLATILSALHQNFPDYEVWMANPGDLIIVAANGGRVPPPDARAFESAELRAQLEPFGIRNLADLHLHRVAGRKALGPYFMSFGAEPNSDYFPVLDLNAARARFMRASANELMALLQSPLPVLELFDGEAAEAEANITPSERAWWPRGGWMRQAAAVREYFERGDEASIAVLTPAFAADVIFLREAFIRCSLRLPENALQPQLASLARYVSPFLPLAERKGLWRQLTHSTCHPSFGASERRWLALYAGVASADGRSMAASAGELLDAEPGLSGPSLAHVLAAYMAGKLLMGEPGAAAQSYAKHRRRLGPGAAEWQPVLRLLVGQADYGHAM